MRWRLASSFSQIRLSRCSKIAGCALRERSKQVTPQVKPCLYLWQMKSCLFRNLSSLTFTHNPMDSFDRLIASVIAAILLAIGVVIIVGDHAGVPIREIHPAEGSTPSSTTPVRIVFTQQMDTASVEARFKISPTVAGQLSWEADMLVFQPT